MKRDPLVTLPAALIGPGAGVSAQSRNDSAPSRPAGPGTFRVQARYAMGVDGGATKTLAAVFDMHERTLHLGHGGSSNPDAVGAHTATESLLKATDEAIARAGIEREQLDTAVLAIAGTDTDAVAAHVRELRPSSWLVVNDVVGAWAAATGAQPGVGVISGTGSNVFGVGADGRAWRAGGWGHVLGDEGSGYGLAVESIKAALADRDRSGPETALSDAAVGFFGVDSVEALATLVYSKPLTKGEIAAFAVEAARVAHAGDTVARELYRSAAAELGRQVAAVVEQTGLADDFPVGLIGSAFKAGALFVEPLTAAVHGVAPRARVAVVEMAPVGGCVLLAARVAGREQAVDPADLKRSLDEVLAREGIFRE